LPRFVEGEALGGSALLKARRSLLAQPSSAHASRCCEQRRLGILHLGHRREYCARTHSERIVSAAVHTDAIGIPSPTARRLANASPTAVPAQRSTITIDQNSSIERVLSRLAQALLVARGEAS